MRNNYSITYQKLSTIALGSLIAFCASRLVSHLVLYKNTGASEFFIFAIFSIAALMILVSTITDSRTKVIILFLTFLLALSTTLPTIIQLAVHPSLHDELGRSSHSFLAKTQILAMLWFLVGATNYKARLTNNTPLALFVILTCLGVIAINTDGGQIQYDLLKEKPGLNNSTHLMLAYPALIIIYYCYSKSIPNYRLPIYIIGAVSLFLIGGRSSLAAYLGSFLVLLVLTQVNSLASRISLFTLFFVAAIAPLIYFQEIILEDPSIKTRIELLLSGINYINEQILYGNINSIIQEEKSTTAYFHNLFSAIQFYGLAAFITITLTITYILFFILKTPKKEIKKNDFTFGTLIFVSAVLEIAVAKHSGYYLLWYSLGFWLFKINFISKNRPKKYLSPLKAPDKNV